MDPIALQKCDEELRQRIQENLARFQVQAATEARARAAYGEVPMPRLYARFDEARRKLRAMIPAGPE